VIGPALAAALLFAFAVDDDPAVGRAQELYDAGKWAETVAVWRGLSDPPPALDYYAGMALARMERLDEARDALEAGSRKDPRDKRFPIELAGLAYKRREYSSAALYLHRALRLDPQDRYASDFLATIYFLRQNLDAALPHWNRTGKPRVEQIRQEPEPRVRPALLDQAFAVAPATVLTLGDLRSTQASLDLLGIFSRYRFALAPRDVNETFDLVFRSAERNGWGDTKWQGVLLMLRGAPYATLYPEWYNMGRSAVNVTSLARFDPEKLRMSASVSGPAAGNPHLRWRFFLDGRKENWNLTRSFHGAGAAPDDLHVEKIEGGGEMRGVIGANWGWSSAVGVADRKFARAPVAAGYFTDGVSVKYRGQIDRALLYLPERRLSVTSSAFGEFGKLFAAGFGPYSRAGAVVETRWFPEAQGDRYRLSTSVRTGTASGAVPFDELFMLGLERDNDLPLRAHIGTEDGRKGSAPLGRTYFLWNAELDRKIYDAGFLKIKLGPFFDSGRITDSAGIFGSQRRLWDTGVQLKVSVLSTVTIAFSYGKDLGSGRNAFYATALGP
jgi:hypothetical protein